MLRCTHSQTLPKLRQSVAQRRARYATEGENEPDDGEKAEPLKIAVQHHACLGGVCEGNHIFRRLGGAVAREACGSEAQGEVGSDPRGSSQPRRRHYTTPLSSSLSTTTTSSSLHETSDVARAKTLPPPPASISVCGVTGEGDPAAERHTELCVSLSRLAIGALRAALMRHVPAL